MAGAVEITSAAGIATVTVANPPVNALSDRVIEQLGASAEQLAADPDVRAVILTGAGERTFLAGADLNEFDAALGDAEKMEGHVSLTRRVFAAWEELPMPAIAAIGGHATGGGLEMALVCDLIVVDPRARLGLPELMLGLMPGAGGTQRLPRRVGSSRATRMLLFSQLIDAQEALDVGLVDAISEEGGALATAEELAARIARGSRGAIAAAKQALRAASAMPLAEGLEYERKLFLGVADGRDAREGVAAFMAKRKPEFGG